MESITLALYGWEEEFMRKAAASGLTARQIHHLDAIADLGNPSPSEISARLGITKPSVTALLARLGAAGHVRRSRTDGDKRGYHVHVTARGQGFVEEHRAVHERMAALFTSALSAREVEALGGMIRKALAALESGKTPRKARGSSGGGKPRAV